MTDLAGIPQPKRYPPSATGGRLLFWPLDGPTLETSGLAVMTAAGGGGGGGGGGPTDPLAARRAPYYDAAAGAGAWHPVSRQPVSEPRVSAVTVRVAELDEWVDSWEEVHWEHGADGFRCEDGVGGGDEVGGHSPHDGGGGGGGGVAGSHCACGAVKPVGVKDLSVVVTGTGGVTEGSGDGGGFVTVHDYVTAVHPWLMGLRNDILGALGTMNGDDAPLPADTELMVCYDALDSLRIMKREEWIRMVKKEPSPGFSLRELLE
ncbi:uncharacterized protein THITE_159031 [Thermothielavioides terrestris NRRL 8126]|uniref:Uncharacterized protein n=1 Tax=Thermothielavioides terrestris (strain ATCC 38088 / NRRL 8126) TaxID=578455 RepID=G2RHF6_THETT|nr:uncharacterized protein THITE_159031 [Thermothielavioides terrestris NRRL 8126]AEO71268.1 hypothetical protein THITE_159031 [Thermothielavioides terrestris NRRL 8126]